MLTKLTVLFSMILIMLNPDYSARDNNVRETIKQANKQTNTQTNKQTNNNKKQQKIKEKQNQHTRELISAGKTSHKRLSTTAKTWVAIGNSQLACV